MSGFLLNPYVFGKLTSLTFLGRARSYSYVNVSSLDIDISGISWKAGDLCVATIFKDSNMASATAIAGSGNSFTSVVENYGGSEYPEGETWYRILQSGDSNTVTLTMDGADDCTAGLQIFRPNTPIKNVVVGNTITDDGPSALNTTLTAESPATVASGEILFKGFVLTGRITTTHQNPTPTFTQSGWTNNDAGSSGCDLGYKILTAGDTDVNEKVTTNDTGRQAYHIYNLTLT